MQQNQSLEITKVALDAMGGDYAPAEPVKGAVDAVNARSDIKVLLIGQEDVVRKELEKYTYPAELIEFLSVDCTASEGEWHSDSEIKIDKLGYVIRNGNKTKEFWDGCIRVDQQPLRLKIRNICGDETVWKV